MVWGASILTGLVASGILLFALIITHSIFSDAWMAVFLVMAYPGVIASRAFYREFHIHWTRLVRVSR